MKNTVRNFLIFAATALLPAAVSCQQDDTLQYNNVTMGNVVEGTFISDQGNIFNVVEQDCIGKIDTMKRAIVVCDVLRKTEGEENTYDIRLTGMSSVLAKEPVILSDITDEDIMVTDPVHIREIWYSGGYLNMYLIFPFDHTVTRPHLINLVLDDTLSSGQDYTFELRHNAFGEVWSEEEETLPLGGAYVSFPIGKVIPGDSAQVTLKWKWHKEVNFGYTLETVDNEMKFEWKRTAFEQTPLSLATKTVTEIM